MTKKRLLYGIGAAALLPLGSTLLMGGIAGSPHDFSDKPWNSTHQACVVCHTPHQTRPANSESLLWNRPLSRAVYTLYKSETLRSTTGSPDGSTKLCLSCHDGTVAIDSFGGQSGTAFIIDSANLGTDLSNSHPVSFAYDSGLVAAAKTLKDPTAAPSGLGGTIAQDLLREGKVQCVSCHDVHNRFNQDDLLIKDNRGSALCLTCHDF